MALFGVAGLGALSAAQGAMGGSSLMGLLGSGGSLLSGLGSLGGLFGSSGTSSKQASRLAVEAEQRALSNQHILATHMPAWTVQGAKNAGIHPLAALGMPQVSAPMAQVGGGSSGPSAFERMGALGQDLSRAVLATRDNEDRKMALMGARLQLENQSLQNDVLRSQLMRSMSAQVGPAIPGVTTIPKEIISRNGPTEAGIAAAHQLLEFTPGNYVRAPGSAMADANLDDGPASWYYQLSRTLPDMVKADMMHKGSQVKSAVRKSWSNRSRWKSRDYWMFND